MFPSTRLTNKFEEKGGQYLFQLSRFIALLSCISGECINTDYPSLTYSILHIFECKHIQSTLKKKVTLSQSDMFRLMCVLPYIEKLKKGRVVLQML